MKTDNWTLPCSSFCLLDLRQVSEKNLGLWTALIVGPEDTPYAHGMYLFEVRVDLNKYPHFPPTVKMLTTDGKTRINPNLYANGKVCLSILGTWSGPGWIQSMTLSSVLMQIQTLMNEDPLQNEPGYEKTKRAGGKGKGKGNRDKYVLYAETVQHANLRFLVNQVRGTLPQVGKPFLFLMRSLFLSYFPALEQVLARKQRERPQRERVVAIWNTEDVDYAARRRELSQLKRDLEERGSGRGSGGAAASAAAVAVAPGVLGVAPSPQHQQQQQLPKKRKEVPSLAGPSTSGRAAPSASVAPVVVDLTGESPEVEAKAAPAPPSPLAKKQRRAEVLGAAGTASDSTGPADKTKDKKKGKDKVVIIL